MRTMTIHDFLSAAGREFLKTFASSILIFAPGVAQAQNLNQAYALGVAALIASIAAGLGALQKLLPFLSFASYIGGMAGEVLDAFVQAFGGSFIVGWLGVLNAPHDGFSWKAAVISVLVGAVNAGLRAAQHVIAPSPVPQAVPKHVGSSGTRGR